MESYRLKLIQALNATAASLQSSAQSEADVYRAYKREVALLGLRGAIALLDENGERARIVAQAIPPFMEKTMHRLERLTGYQVEGYSFSITKIDVYRDVIRTKQAVYLPESGAVVRQMIPEGLLSMAKTIIKAIRLPPTIYAPLVTITGFLGYLEKAAAAGDMERFKLDSRRIQQSVTKMHPQLNELIELSRIGRMMNPPQTIPFEEVVREALDLVHGRVVASRAAVQTQPDLPPVYGDRQRLVEVLQNLIDNAAKFTGGQTDPRIEIGQRGEEDGKPVFYVKDNGPGIAPEYHQRVFGLFDKLDPRAEGTGIGLALVKRIIEFHGGRIWIESVGDGRGAAFYFTLPPAPIANRAG